MYRSLSSRFAELEVINAARMELISQPPPPRYEDIVTPEQLEKFKVESERGRGGREVLTAGPSPVMWEEQRRRERVFMAVPKRKVEAEGDEEKRQGNEPQILKPQTSTKASEQMSFRIVSADAVTTTAATATAGS
jgi:hypothetical protein